MENKNDLLIGIIVLLVIIILGLGGFIAYTIGKNSNNNLINGGGAGINNQQQNTETQEKELTDVNEKKN